MRRLSSTNSDIHRADTAEEWVTRRKEGAAEIAEENKESQTRQC
jgi:hypothetical protein